MRHQILAAIIFAAATLSCWSMDEAQAPKATQATYEDAKVVGVPINEVGFLDKCIELMGQPATAAKARQLLERYTGQSFADTKAWQQWLDGVRNKLYFSDHYDHRFYSGPAGSAPAAEEVQNASQALQLEAPNEYMPAIIGAAVVGDARSRPAIDGKAAQGANESGAYRTNTGTLVTLVVRMRIAAGWYTYARVPEGEADVPTEINVDLPAGARWHGEWQTPTSYDGIIPGLTEYRGDIVFTRQLYFTSVPKEGRGPGQVATIALHGTVRYQACNKEQCRPPRSTPFWAKIVVQDS